MPFRRRLDHVLLIVRDLDVSAAFYRDVLGLSEISNGTGRDKVLSHLDTKGIAYGDWPGMQGKVHVRPDGVRGVYLEDPDGHWIEINDHH
jgi:catechol 2,3-dioxygenase-like lactoylglutathione lyase family enzyme